MRKYFVLIAICVLFTVVILTRDTAFGSCCYYWSGTELDAFMPRGISARITTPGSAPVTYGLNPNGQAHWVSTIRSDAWIQTGWSYYPADTSGAKKYVEYLTTSGDYWINPPYEYGPQPWGTNVEYEVTYYTSSGEWCAVIDGIVKQCRNIGFLPPVKVGAKSEVFGNSRTEISTSFYYILYQRPDNIWTLINGNTFAADFPYGYHRYSDSYFDTYRLATQEVFVPLVMK